MSRILALLLSVAVCCTTLFADDAQPVEQQAFNLLKSRCYNCHGVEFKFERLNVLDPTTLTADRGDNRRHYVKPGDLSSSRIWDVIDEDYMPPSKPLSEDERAVIRQWIEEGAKWPTLEQREFVSNIEVLKTISLHLFSVRKDDRKFQRYFTLSHLHNNSALTDMDLRLYRAGLSKAVNALSSQATIVTPKPLDDALTVFAIDLRHYGWEDISVWDNVIEAYPYGLKPQTPEGLEEYEKIEDLFGAFFDGVPHLRADWFIAQATRPPIYHELAKIPEKLDGLTEKLDVNINQNIQLGTAKRAGLFESGVSSQNRLVEYHSSGKGGFWLSYDFQLNSGRANLARFPLGPKFEGNQFDAFAFEHDGGEIIFNLPNGLHGYMLIDGKGDRIDKGPVDIVWDSLNSSGNPEIVNGISCMACHKHGTLALTDYVREGVAIENVEARRKVRQLYPEIKELSQLIKQGREDYLQKLKQAVGPFLQVDDDEAKPITQFPEPISFVSRLYARNLNLEAAAREFGFENIDEFKNKIDNRRVKELGLGPLALENGTLKRSFWDARESTTSVFQEAASEMSRGTPVP